MLKERDRWRALPDRWDLPDTIDDAPRELLDAIGRLAPQQRAVLILRHYVGYDASEIGSLLGISRATVRVHLSRGRRRLAAILEEIDA